LTSEVMTAISPQKNLMMLRLMTTGAVYAIHYALRQNYIVNAQDASTQYVLNAANLLTRENA
jgi:hypothetical protein